MRQQLKSPEKPKPEVQPPVLPESINPTRELEFAVAKLRQLADHGNEATQVKAAAALMAAMRPYLPAKQLDKPQAQDDHEPLTPERVDELLRQTALMAATEVREGRLSREVVREHLQPLMDLLN